MHYCAWNIFEHQEMVCFIRINTNRELKRDWRKFHLLNSAPTLYNRTGRRWPRGRHVSSVTALRAEFLLSVGSGELRVRGSGRGVDDPSAGAESLLRQGSCRAPVGTGRREGLRQGARPAAPWAVSHAASACSAGACPTGRLLRGRPRPARTPGLGGSGGA